jgi:hypothetical protein
MIALIQISPLAVIQQWSTLPTMVRVPGSDIHAPSVGWTDGAYKIVDVVTVGSAVDQFSELTGTSLSLNGNTLTITRTYTQRSPTKAELLAYTVKKKQAKSVGGTNLGATVIPTDFETRTLLSLAYTEAVNTPGFTMPWNGTTLNATQIQAGARQVGKFLAQVLATEETTKAAINAGTITTVAQVDAAFA